MAGFGALSSPPGGIPRPTAPAQASSPTLRNHGSTSCVHGFVCSGQSTGWKPPRVAERRLLPLHPTAGRVPHSLPGLSNSPPRGWPTPSSSATRRRSSGSSAPRAAVNRAVLVCVAMCLLLSSGGLAGHAVACGFNPSGHRPPSFPGSEGPGFPAHPPALPAQPPLLHLPLRAGPTNPGRQGFQDPISQAPAGPGWGPPAPVGAPALPRRPPGPAFSTVLIPWTSGRQGSPASANPFPS